MIPIIAALAHPRSQNLATYDFTTNSSGSLADLSVYGLSFARASNGFSVQDGANAVITTGYLNSNDTPRFGRRLAANSVGLVIETSRTNLVLQSRDLTNGVWSTTGAATLTRPVGSGPDGNTNDPTRVQTATGTNGRFQAVFFTSSPVAGYAWMRGDTVGKSINICLSGASGNGSNAVADTLWRQYQTFSATTTTVNFIVDDSRAFGVTAGARDGEVDLCQLEKGNFVTEWIETTSATGTRAGERLYHPSSGNFIDNGRISMELKIRPKGSSSQYTNNMRLWTIDASNYVEINSSTAVITVVVGGNTYTVPVAPFWNQYDLLELFVGAGGGSIPTKVEYRVNGGSTVTLSTGSPPTQPSVSGTGALDMLCNGTANEFTSWVYNLNFYKSGAIPSWVV